MILTVLIGRLVQQLQYILSQTLFIFQMHYLTFLGIGLSPDLKFASKQNIFSADFSGNNCLALEGLVADDYLCPSRHCIEQELRELSFCVYSLTTCCLHGLCYSRKLNGNWEEPVQYERWNGRASRGPSLSSLHTQYSYSAPNLLPSRFSF